MLIETIDNLTHDYLKSLLDYNSETGIFIWNSIRRGGGRFGNKAGSLDKDGYVVIYILGKVRKAHRLAWFYMTGEWPKEQIDHIDMNKSNNAFSNLREASNSENKMNVRLQSNSTSGYRGVCWHKGHEKWQVHIKLNGIKSHIGYFRNIEDAVEAQRKAVVEYHPKFGRSA